jgi:phosphatidylserine/phosphatidylglycerophosphate/cardiolipin synthase-like enzyme
VVPDHGRGRGAPAATVLRTRPLGGRPTRNHSKVVSVDHRFLLVTSANFSWSAEYGNLQLGVLIDNVALAEAVENKMRQVEDLAFKRVHSAR